MLQVPEMGYGCFYFVSLPNKKLWFWLVTAGEERDPTGEEGRPENCWHSSDQSHWISSRAQDLPWRQVLIESRNETTWACFLDFILFLSFQEYLFPLSFFPLNRTWILKTLVSLIYISNLRSKLVLRLGFMNAGFEINKRKNRKKFYNQELIFKPK